MSLEVHIDWKGAFYLDGGSEPYNCMREARCGLVNAFCIAWRPYSDKLFAVKASKPIEQKPAEALAECAPRPWSYVISARSCSSNKSREQSLVAVLAQMCMNRLSGNIHHSPWPVICRSFILLPFFGE
jgi:hypothetical protein